ncbi:MAG TPA: beta-ketoacyl synthase N-terminal-like domain-containing protein, partial [Tepidisphaeraceae bacterium]
PSPCPLPGYRERGKTKEVLITGIGVLLPNVNSMATLAERMQREDLRALTEDVGAIPESAYLHLLNARRVRRMSEYVKLSLAATALAFTDAKISDTTAFAETCSVILGSTHGSTNYSTAYYEQIVKEGIAAANPMMFAEGVPNAAAAHLSLMQGLKGACQTVIGSRTAGLDALRLAAARIASGAWERAIVGAAEEYHDLINGSYNQCGVYARDGVGGPFDGGKGFVAGAGAVTLILESRESMEKRGGRAWGRIGRTASARTVAGAPVEATARVLEELGHPAQIVTSANSSWVDRAELLGIRQTGRQATVSSVYGHVAESFSVMPMIGIAATLVSRRLPRLLAELDEDRARSARGEPLERDFAVLCTDYTGVVSGVSLSAVER